MHLLSHTVLRHKWLDETHFLGWRCLLSALASARRRLESFFYKRQLYVHMRDMVPWSEGTWKTLLSGKHKGAVCVCRTSLLRFRHLAPVSLCSSVGNLVTTTEHTTHFLICQHTLSHLAAIHSLADRAASATGRLSPTLICDHSKSR